MKTKNKKLWLFAAVFISVIVLVSAAVYFHSVSVTGSIDEALSSDTFDMDFSGYPAETIVNTIDVQHEGSVPLTVKLSFVESLNRYTLDNSAGTCMPYPSSTCEKRVIVPQEDLGITDLSELNTIEWEADVLEGYLPHVDVFLDNGETLVFEYAKVQTPCDNSPYPTGKLNTFDDKGIVDDSAYAWLSSGVAGYCGLLEFDNNHNTLAEWKLVYTDAKILKIEVEIDNWVSNSNSNIWNIEVNGVQVADGVTYTTDMPKEVVVQNGLNTLDVSLTYTTDSPVGIIKGKVNLDRL